MGSSDLALIFLSLFILIMAVVFPAVAQPNILAFQCSDEYGNYTSNSTYKSNLDKLLTNISTTNIPYGFYNLSAGQNSDQVHAIALCRGDIVNVTDCHACIKLVSSNLTESCPIQMYAIGWDEKCMVRYSAGSILGGVWSDHPKFELVTGVDVTGDVYHFTNVVKDLLTSLPNKTADGDSRLKFATGEAIVSSSQMVYAMMQCTPDLIPTDCLGCLYWGLYYVLHSDSGKTGSRVLLPSCSIRYDSQKFYLSSPTQATTPSSPGKMSSNFKMVVGGGVVVACLCILVIILVWCCLRQRTKLSQLYVKLDNGDEAIIFEPLQQDYTKIRYATRDFTEELGRGGFGKVYKGKLASEKEIAVKKLEIHTESTDEEFMNEVRIAARLQHINLAELLGFCLEGNERLLIFEFVSNGSLDNILFDKGRGVQLDWKTRYNIILGIAQGILYLHQHCRNTIVHRDLKAANVLLDGAWKPKITDFGTAKLFKDEETRAVTSRPAGTLGYMAPEYLHEGTFTVKSDVYSFGILVLEIVAGRKNIIHTPNPETLINWARRSWRNGTPLEIVDQTIAATGVPSEMERCILIALLCVQENAESRPEMSSVIHLLTEESRPALVFNIEPPLAAAASLGESQDYQHSDLYPR